MTDRHNNTASSDKQNFTRAFEKAFIHHRKLNTPTQVRHRIRRLRKKYGDCLNTWPKPIQQEYNALARRLRQLESSQ